jgi:hypothetical protein
VVISMLIQLLWMWKIPIEWFISISMLIGFIPDNSHLVLNHFLNPWSAWNSWRLLYVWKRCIQIANNASPRSTARFLYTNKKKDEKLIGKAKLGLCQLRNVLPQRVVSQLLFAKIVLLSINHYNSIISIGNIYTSKRAAFENRYIGI